MNLRGISDGVTTMALIPPVWSKAAEVRTRPCRWAARTATSLPSDVQATLATRMDNGTSPNAQVNDGRA